MDWHAWHDAYGDPDSPLRRRLTTVRRRIVQDLQERPPGPVRALSVCAGQGHDLLGALDGHPRRGDVTARLVELDPRNAAAAARSAAALGLDRVEVVVGDAALTDHYLGLAPADLVLLCGLFGNLTPSDIERAVGFCDRLCATGGTLIWTRNRKDPDLFRWICALLERRGFSRIWVNDPATVQGVGVHRFTGAPPGPLPAGERMFTFVGYDVLAHRSGN